VQVKLIITKFCIFVKFVQNGVHDMAEMYEIIDALLEGRGVSGAQMSADLGMSRSFMTELRKGRAKGIKLETAQKIAEYFNVTVDYLLGSEMPAESGKYNVTDEDIIFALFRGREGITEEMYEEVKNFAEYIAQREANKKSK
jgi:transcriptional regulator with XRE-family HTH domain